MRKEADATLGWVLDNEDPKEVMYILDAEEVGRGDEGFDKVLEHLRSLGPGSRVVIRYPFLLGTAGGPFEEGFPYHSRVDELDRVISEGGLTVIYEPQYD